MNHAMKAVLLLAVGVSGGCAALPQNEMFRTYVDPQYHRADYASLRPLASPIPVNVEGRWLVNGSPVPPAKDNGYNDGSADVRASVEAALVPSRVLKPTREHAFAVLLVVVDDRADLASARAMGSKVGWSFGHKGGEVVDDFAFSCTWRAQGRETQRSYRHAIHTIAGKFPEPVGLERIDEHAAAQKIVDDVVLNCLQDLQDSGVLP